MACLETIIRNMYLKEDHMSGKTVIVMGKKGVVANKTGSDGDTSDDEIYNIRFEDGTISNYPVRDMQMIGESVEQLDEAKEMTFVFPDDRKAKQFDLDIENSGIGMGNRIGNKVTVTNVDTKWRAAIKKAMLKSKGKLIKESYQLDESLVLASDNLNVVKKTAEKLSKQSPDLTYYVVKHNERYMKGMKYAYYEVYQSVDMHLVRGKVKKIAGYGAKVDMRESVRREEDDRGHDDNSQSTANILRAKRKAAKKAKEKTESVELGESASRETETAKKIAKKGKKLGDWVGKSYYEYEGNLWVLGGYGSEAVNRGPINKAKKTLNKSLLKKLKFNESVELDEGTPAYRKAMAAYKNSDAKKVFDILKKKGFRAYAQSDTLVRNMLKKNKGNVQKAAAEIEKKYPGHFKESVELDEAQKRTFNKGDRVVGRRGNFKGEEAKVVRYDWRLGELTVAVAGKKVRVNPSDWNKIKESVELDEAFDMKKMLKIFNKLKKNDKVRIKYDSSVGKGKEFQTFVVTSPKRPVGKKGVERVIMKHVDNPTGVKYTLYNRDGSVSLAIGDMAASMTDIKESADHVEHDLDEASRPMQFPGAMSGGKMKGKFTSAQLKQLKDAYGKIGRIDPSSKAYEKLTAYLDGMNKAILKQLVDAKIPFISSLALNRYHRAK